MSCMFKSVVVVVVFQPECGRCWRSTGLSAAAAAAGEEGDEISPFFCSVTFDLNRKELFIVAALQQLLSPPSSILFLQLWPHTSGWHLLNMLELIKYEQRPEQWVRAESQSSALWGWTRLWAKSRLGCRIFETCLILNLQQKNDRVEMWCEQLSWKYFYFLNVVNNMKPSLWLLSHWRI